MQELETRGYGSSEWNGDESLARADLGHQVGREAGRKTRNERRLAGLRSDRRWRLRNKLRRGGYADDGRGHSDDGPRDDGRSSQLLGARRVRNAVFVGVDALPVLIRSEFVVVVAGRGGHGHGRDRDVIALSGESVSVAGDVFDRLHLAVFVHVAVLSFDVTLGVARLNAERAVRGFESERVRTVVVQLVDVFQNGDDRLFGDFLLGRATLRGSDGPVNGQRQYDHLRSVGIGNEYWQEDQRVNRANETHVSAHCGGDGALVALATNDSTKLSTILI